MNDNTVVEGEMSNEFAESPKDMLSRLALIATGERECDLSDNDALALAWVLNSHKRLYRVAELVVAICDAGQPHVAELACMETSPLVGMSREALAYADQTANAKRAVAPAASEAQKNS